MRLRAIGLIAIVALTLGLFVVPLASEAQLPRTIPRIAYLALAPGPSDAVSSERSEAPRARSPRAWVCRGPDHHHGVLVERGQCRSAP